MFRFLQRTGVLAAEVSTYEDSKPPKQNEPVYRSQPLPSERPLIHPKHTKAGSPCKTQGRKYNRLNCRTEQLKKWPHKSWRLQKKTLPHRTLCRINTCNAFMEQVRQLLRLPSPMTACSAVYTFTYIYILLCCIHMYIYACIQICIYV